MPLFTRGPRRGRGPRHRRRRPAARRRARDGPARAERLRADRVVGRRGRAPSPPCSRRRARPATSTSSRRCGSRRCCWRPGCARRSARPGLTVEQTVPFRDKGRMKEVLDAAGIRTPRPCAATTVAGCREAAEQIGYPGDRQADRRRRLARHLPDRDDADARGRARPPRPRRRGQRGGVHRRRGVHLRHRVQPPAGSASTTSPSTGPARSSASRSSGSSQQVIAHRDPDAPDARRRARRWARR